MLIRRSLIALAAALLAAPALAQTAVAPAAPAAPAPVNTNPHVVINTPKGAITLELFVDKAPITARNYLRYVDRKLYDGATFYRASKPGAGASNDYGVVQGGLQNDPAKVLPPITHESTTKTGLKHTEGTISMGRHAPGSAQADWFICIGDQPYLDADAKQPGFAAFGRIVSGLEVAKSILGEPVNPKSGQGAMKGEMLIRPIRITSIRRTTWPKPAPPVAPAAAIPAPAPPSIATPEAAQ
jgi:peptidyl-prolyl cis-trans isomerase A (cyclophilin A)